MIDHLMTAALILCAVKFRTDQLTITLAAFLCNQILSAPIIFDYFQSSPSLLHSLYALTLIPFIKKSNKKAAVGIGCFALFQCFTAYDYLFYPQIDTIIYTYYFYFVCLLYLCIIYLSMEKIDNVDRDNNADFLSVCSNRGAVSCIRQS